MPKIDWLWLAVGIFVGLLIHKTMVHPKVNNLLGTNFYDTGFGV